jgi:hypothetical protein
VRKAILGVLVAVLAVAVLPGADQSQTVACCGQTPKQALNK